MINKVFKLIDNNRGISIGLFAVFCMIFIIIGHYNKTIQNNLKYNIYNTTQPIVFDVWSLTHLCTYALFGFIMPNFTMTFFTLGFLFEIFEDILSSNKNTQIINCKKNNNLHKLWCNGYSDSYWYAKFDDLLFNLFGYIIGSSTRTTFFNY